MGGLSRGFLVAAVATTVFGCAGASPGAGLGPTPRPAGAQMSGTHGRVLFATERVGWVVAPHPTRHQTDIFRTVDAGVSWETWSSLPEEAGPVAVTETAVLLQPAGSYGRSDYLMFRADGGTWELRKLPVALRSSATRRVTVDLQFLRDMQHGWLVVGWPVPAVVYQTLDGGLTWNQLPDVPLYNIEEAGGSQPVFWSATEGTMSYMQGNRFVQLLTHDGGLTWQATALPLIDAKHDLGRKTELTLNPESPTMFDNSNGVMMIYVWNPADRSPDQSLRKIRYLTRTSDGGKHWSAARLIHLPVAGSTAVLDAQRLVLAGDRHVYFTADAGEHWRESEGMDAGLWRGDAAGIRVIESNRDVAFLTFSAVDIEWLTETMDGGAHWKPVPLPDVREQSWTGVWP